jgi:ribonucleoside-diphosphate reductase beta chain
LYPIKYPDLWDLYKKHQRVHWTAEEIDFGVDKKDWNIKLTDNERYFIEHILAFFAGSDGIVLENLVTNFCCEVQIPEARFFYSFQAMMENVHSEVYSLMIDTFIDDPARKDELFHAINEIPCIQQKAQWSMQWIHPENSFATRLLGFIMVEGIFFSGSFCSIFWLKERGLLVNSLGKSNEWIARDEGLHQNFGIHLYNHYIQHRVSSEVVHTMVRNAVEIESNFLTKSLPVRLIGMNHSLMIQYIQYVADRILVQIGYNKLYHVSNPFAFMEKIHLDGKTNFFEQRVSEYSMGHSNHLSSDSFSLDDNNFF